MRVRHVRCMLSLLLLPMSHFDAGQLRLLVKAICLVEYVEQRFEPDIIASSPASSGPGGP